MFLRCRGSVVIEVVDDEALAIRGDMDIEFEESRNEAGGNRCRAGEGQKNVAFCVYELEDDARGQVGTEAYERI
ncbi:hypothetical protein RRF57_008040 [Xylaria bambusicola]|uniref:Uncharacterized protein n=1 Tax=Xylaria bambusicola TaxID=326684 RepID=A0AAN7UT21_9PEZI